MSLFDRVKDWGYRVFLFKESDPKAQVKKLLEEVYELSESISIGTDAEVKMEIGDCLVVLNVLCHMTDNVPDDCLRLALVKIEKRKGKMVDGAFVKERE